MPRKRKPNYFRSLYLLPYALLAVCVPILFQQAMGVISDLGNVPMKPYGGIPLWILLATYGWAAYALAASVWRFYKDHVLGEYYADVVMGRDRYQEL